MYSAAGGDSAVSTDTTCSSSSTTTTTSTVLAGVRARKAMEDKNKRRQLLLKARADRVRKKAEVIIECTTVHAMYESTHLYVHYTCTGNCNVSYLL